MVRYDSSAVMLRAPDPDVLASFRQDPAFNYDQHAEPEAPWWQRLWWWFVRTVLEPVFGAVPDAVYRWVLYGLLGVALVYAVTRMLQLNLRSVVAGRSDQRRVPFDAEEGDLERINVEQRIAQAEARDDYREAVRWQYLHALQRLAAAHLIVWKIDKTNHQYLQEVPAGSLRRRFADLTLQFEYVWYGDQPIDEARYQHIRRSFEHFAGDLDSSSSEATASPPQPVSV